MHGVPSCEGAEGDGQQARGHARAVAAALKTSLTGGEFEQLATQLPGEYDDLLGTGPVQHHQGQSQRRGGSGTRSRSSAATTSPNTAVASSRNTAASSP
jgi:hypothetical protein